MEDKKVFAGFGVVIALLFVVALARGVFDPGDVEDMVAGKIAPVNDAVAALEGRLAESETAIDGRLAELQSGLDQQLSEVQQSMEGRLASLQTALEALSERAQAGLDEGDMEEVRARLEELAMQSGELSAIVAALGAGGELPMQAAPETAAVPIVPAAADPGEPGLMPGQTALFSDGNLRVFVSRLDAHTDSLRASVNGERKTLRQDVGRTVPVGDGHCRIMLDGVSDNGALISAVCGDDLPPAEGISAGETALLQDGALRVFASRITEDTARLSANGAEVTLDAGDRATLMIGERSCRLTLEQVDRGHAQVSAECTDDVWLSDMMTAGEAAMLGDGAARVFVSFVMPDGSARIAVNGLALSTVRDGDTAAMADNCDLTVEDVSRRAAGFSYACYN